MILMTNNPLKIKGLDGFGLEVVGREPIEMTCNEKNEFYMYTKYKRWDIYYMSEMTGKRRIEIENRD